MRVKIYKDQSVLVYDTTSRKDPVSIQLQAQEATAVFFDNNRANVDQIDAGGNPKGGFFLTNAMAPITRQGVREQMWARAGAETEIDVNIFEMRLETQPVAASHRTVLRPVYGGNC